MPPRREVKSPIQLLVEGADAQFFFMHFLNHMGFNNVEVQDEVEWRGHSRVYREAPDLISGLGMGSKLDEDDLSAFSRVCNAILDRLDPSDVEISNFGGVSELRGFLKAVWSAPNARNTIEAIGIIRDAESLTCGTESAAEAAFKSAHAAISASGLTPPDRPLQVIGKKPRIGVLILPPGKLEGMLEDVCLEAVQADLAMPCVDEYIECIKRSVPDWYSRNLKKAKVQAFLASRPEPGLKLGEGAKLGYWNWSHEAYNPIEQFIRDLTGQ